MNKDEALLLIDEYKNSLINPVDMLPWVWLRVTILKVDDVAWRMAAEEAVKSVASIFLEVR